MRFFFCGCLAISLASVCFYANAQSSSEDADSAKAMHTAVANSHYNVVSKSCVNGLVQVWKDMKFGKRGTFSSAESFIIEERADCIVVHVAFKKQAFGGSMYKLSKDGDRIVEFGLER